MTINFNAVSEPIRPPSSNKGTTSETQTPEYHPVQPYNPLDIERAKKNMEVYDKKIDEIVKSINNLEVNSERSAAAMTEMISQAAGLSKKIKANGKGIYSDAYDFYVTVRNFANFYAKKLDDQGVAVGKEKIGAHQAEKEMQRREIEAKARAEQARLQKEMDARAKKSGVGTVQVPDVIVPQSTGPIRTESGTASVTMRWKWRVLHPGLIPRDFMQPNKKAIDDAVAAGIREITGLEIFEEPQVRVRTN